MSLRSDLSGTFTLAGLERLTFPVAWSATKDRDEATSEESELRDFVRDAREQLQDFYNNQGDGETDYEVEIKDGQITGFVEA